MTINNDFKKTKIFIMFILLALLLFNYFFIDTSTVKAREIIVGNSNQANFTSIQEAIKNASFNDTIKVEKNTYNEQVIINKTIQITATPGTIISCEDFIYGFYLKCNNSTVEGFIFKNNEVGVFIEESFNNKISNNTFEHNKNGIYLTNSSSNLVSDNYFISNSEGIRLFKSSKNVVKNNLFIDHKKSIYLWENSNRNILLNNNITSGGSISLQRWCNYNLISENYLEEGSISLHKCYYNEILKNIVKDVDKGVSLSYSSNNTIFENVFNNCEVSGVYTDNSEDNIIESNEYINTPESIKNKPQAPKIKIPGFETILFFVILFSFVLIRKRF